MWKNKQKKEERDWYRIKIQKYGLNEYKHKKED
jgi:hypothetical protein